MDALNLADQLKYEQKHGIAHHRLAGQDPGDDLPEVLHPDPGLL